MNTQKGHKNICNSIMKNKVFKTIKTIFNVAITAFVVLFLLMVLLQRFSNNELTFLGYRMFSVASASMAPDYHVGDVLITKQTKPKDIKIGDDVSYYGKVGTFKDKVVTHKVVKIEKDVDGKLVFHTKGIANLVEDPLVYEDQIYGVVKHKSTILSFIYKTINTKYGMFIFIVVPIFYVIGSEMLSFMLEKEEEKRNKMKKDKEIEQEAKEKKTKSGTKTKTKAQTTTSKKTKK